MRVLVTLSPCMYREAIALSIRRNRPDLAEVRIAPPDAAEAQIASFRPYLLVHDEARGSEAPTPADTLVAVPCRVEVLYSGGMHARVCAGGRRTEIRDVSTDDLLGAVDASLARRGGRLLDGPRSWSRRPHRRAPL